MNFQRNRAWLQNYYSLCDIDAADCVTKCDIVTDRVECQDGAEKWPTMPEAVDKTTEQLSASTKTGSV